MADGQMTPDTPQTMDYGTEVRLDTNALLRQQLAATAAELERCKEALADTEGMLHAAQIRGDALHVELAKLRESTAPDREQVEEALRTYRLAVLAPWTRYVGAAEAERNIDATHTALLALLFPANRGENNG